MYNHFQILHLNDAKFFIKRKGGRKDRLLRIILPLKSKSDQPATLCELSVRILAIESWTAWNRNCCCRSRWRHHYPCIQPCAHSSDWTEHVSFHTILPRALSSAPAFLVSLKKVYFHRLLSNFSGLDLVLVYTVSEVHILLLEQLGEGFGAFFV